MKYSIVTVLLFSTLALAACGISYRNREVKRFIGRSQADLYAEYGRPWSVATDSKGQKVLTFEIRWTEDVRTEGESWTDSSGVTHHNPPSVRRETHVEHRIFTIDPNGRVIKARWRLW
ncbi:MAG: hypothetical protein RB296_06275 [Acidobacteriota bacterium]|nr:hypothetical protein [Acidobacteriota bacterium]